MTPELLVAVNSMARLGLGFLVQSTVLVVAVLLIGRYVVKTSAARSTLYQATLVAVAVLPVVGGILSAKGVSLLSLPLPEARMAASEAGEEGLGRPPATSRSPAVGAGPEAGEAPAPEGGAVRAEERRSGVAGLWATVRTHPFGVLYTWALIAWALGAVLLLGHLWICHRLLRRMRRRSALYHDYATLAGLHGLCGEMGVRMPWVLLSREVKSPALTGLVRPAILLPHTLAGSRPDERLMDVLLHELAHLARHDHVANLLGRILCCAFFFQPLVWMLVHRVEEAADEVADDIVLDGGATATTYAKELVYWTERYFPSHSEAIAAVGVVRFRSALGRRVARILDGARRLVTRLHLRTVVAIALSVALLCGLASLLAPRRASGTGVGTELRRHGPPLEPGLSGARRAEPATELRLRGAVRAADAGDVARPGPGALDPDVLGLLADAWMRADADRAGLTLGGLAATPGEQWQRVAARRDEAGAPDAVDATVLETHGVLERPHIMGRIPVGAGGQAPRLSGGAPTDPGWPGGFFEGVEGGLDHPARAVEGPPEQLCHRTGATRWSRLSQ